MQLFYVDNILYYQKEIFHSIYSLVISLGESKKNM